MADRYINNQLLEEVVFDLSKVFNLDFERDLTTEQEISAESRRVAGMLVQPVSGNTAQYQVAKGYYQQKGASEQSAGTLALIVSNIARLTGKSTNSIIRELESSDISFTDEIYKQINHLRNPQSQWFKFNETRNERSYFFLDAPDCFCAAPENLVLDCDVLEVTNLQLSYIADSFARLSIIPFDTTITIPEEAPCPLIGSDMELALPPDDPYYYPVSGPDRDLVGGQAGAFYYIPGQYPLEFTLTEDGFYSITDNLNGYGYGPVPVRTGTWISDAPVADTSDYEVKWDYAADRGLIYNYADMISAPAAEGAWVDFTGDVTWVWETDTPAYYPGDLIDVTIRQKSDPGCTYVTTVFITFRCYNCF